MAVYVHAIDREATSLSKAEQTAENVRMLTAQLRSARDMLFTFDPTADKHNCSSSATAASYLPRSQPTRRCHALLLKNFLGIILEHKNINTREYCSDIELPQYLANQS